MQVMIDIVLANTIPCATRVTKGISIFRAGHLVVSQVTVVPIRSHYNAPRVKERQYNLVCKFLP